MIVRDLPRWAVWLMNIAVIAVLYAITQFFKWTGPEFAFGAAVGMIWNYIAYKNWRQDYADEARAHFTESEEPPPPQLRQRSRDPTDGR